MRIDDKFLYLDDVYINPKKKITGHSFVALVKLDNFKKPGDCLLEMHNIVKEEVDPKWLRRGDFAENIVERVYRRDGHNPVKFDKKVIKYDNFHDSPIFGGIIDFDIPSEQTLIEVKSKSLDKYHFIVSNPPKSEIYQAMYYGYLRHYDSIIMEWIFFDKETEEEVFSGKKPTTLKNLRRYTHIYPIDKAEMSRMFMSAEQTLKDFRKEKKIPLYDISDKYLEKIKEIIKNEQKILETKNNNNK